ncbi:tRNA 2-thiocytidine(32) synthetase TtcA [Trichlorobacter lovleyi]|uniref:tRNA 2-thiocytidine(32) synthetase TtcA n=1 Tax=Trichlorobacter lovleyi TaxID=313985 RepID=UPI0023F53008|nr:tRNA 2-thiocytidine(32) synthetase TtcA [Trichlorobacter lovleyi]
MSKYADNSLKIIYRHVGKAVVDYQMIEDGDKIMAGISGGKDSFVMLDALLHLQRVSKTNFEVIAVNLNQKKPGFPEHVLPNYFESNGIDHYIIEEDTYSIVRSKIPEGKITCPLCSRLRRGKLYGFAEKIGATKIALGHHMDDIVETMFLNMFFHSKLSAMPPKLLSDDKRNVVIRPLAYCREKEIAYAARDRAYPIIPNNLCGGFQKDSKRQAVKAMLSEWDKEQSDRVANIFRSLQKVHPSQLADKALFNFSLLHANRHLN